MNTRSGILRTTDRPVRDSAPEQAALSAVERGDYRSALEILMNAYGDRILGYCLKMLGRRSLAEDARQTTFVQAFQGLVRFERRSSFQTWLFGIARHRCLDLIRSEQRRTERFEPLDSEVFPAPPSHSTETAALNRSVGQAIQECLQRIPEHKREALLLRFQQGLTYPEMSELSGESPATLQARVARILPSVRRCLEAKGVTL